MRKLLFVSALLLFSVSIKAQNKNTSALTTADTTIYSMIDNPPDFTGGPKKFYQYVITNLKPTGDKGIVYLTFVVEKDGSLTNIIAARHLSENADKEAIRLMSGSPKWKPGTNNNGSPVRVRYTIPVRFN